MKQEVRADSYAEAAILGALFVDENVFWEVSLRPEHFYVNKHRMIFSAIESLAADGVTADLVTVTKKMRDDGTLEKVGGAVEVSAMLDDLPSIANAEHYAGIIKREYEARKVLAAARILENSLSHGATAKEALESFDCETAETLNDTSKKPEEVSDVAKRISEIPAKVKADGGKSLRRWNTGLLSIDAALTVQPGNVYVIGGAPSAGKSALLDQFACGMAKDGASVVSFAVEMTREQRVMRTVSRLSGYSIKAIETGYLKEQELLKVRRSAEELEEMDWVIDDRRGITTFDIKSTTRRLQVKKKIDVVMVDDLQLLRPIKAHSNREREVAEMMHELTNMAGDLDVAMFVASQLSRDHERQKRPPELYDFRESGAIEQDAFAAIAIYRPDKNDPAAEIRLLKNRQGPTLDIMTEYMGARFEFRDNVTWT